MITYEEWKEIFENEINRTFKVYYVNKKTNKVVTPRCMERHVYDIGDFEESDFYCLGSYASHKGATLAFQLQQYIKELQERGELKPFRFKEFKEVSPKHMSRI